MKTSCCENESFTLYYNIISFSYLSLKRCKVTGLVHLNWQSYLTLKPRAVIMKNIKTWCCDAAEPSLGEGGTHWSQHHYNHT